MLLALIATASAVDFQGLFTLTHWRGLVVAPEYRCSEYDRGDYGFKRQRHEKALLERDGPNSPYLPDPYLGDIEAAHVDHLVALSEAHDSGLCAASAERKREFGNDADNLFFAPADLNRLKGGDDATYWHPQVRRCWFAKRVIKIRLAYELTVDLYEVVALEYLLTDCAGEELAR